MKLSVPMILFNVALTPTICINYFNCLILHEFGSIANSRVSQKFPKVLGGLSFFLETGKFGLILPN